MAIAAAVKLPGSLTAPALRVATLFSIKPPVMFTLAPSVANMNAPFFVHWHVNVPPATSMSQVEDASDERQHPSARRRRVGFARWAVKAYGCEFAVGNDYFIVDT